mmetsp:Transcript_10212/g.9900  ORF Transcript_10212/g.9900 Transcript_10212/m.9900 type:complete len:258 (+) Transcript_10212:135-908(+)|eukprot:CAMPEP_0119052706 /NCGR_PEP_ID=MMETSP1177-20130426/73908_1 /TAXON_ID=2985 /ORGANISM="Ochromonas sp, Strain CCMP1899" /LENGTH=257 /DNA_ID=CAMNT_0007032357 /DNA_START=103 /DNA_END=876 /DNA_ORIENTATION=-
MHNLSSKSDDGGALPLFDDEDFLEFLVEWSDTIAERPKEGSGKRNSSASVVSIEPLAEQPLKRKLDGLTASPVKSEAEIDADLLRLPIGIFEAFNTGDLQGLKQRVDEGMTFGCLFKTMMMNEPMVGRNVYVDFWSKLSVSHPDMVFILKKVRLSGTGAAKCVKFNYFFTGTNAFPGKAEMYYYNRDKMHNNLDSSKFTEKEKLSMDHLIAQHKAHGTPYVAFGRGSGLFHLNEEGKVVSIFFDWKLTSICLPVGDN